MRTRFKEPKSTKHMFGMELRGADEFEALLKDLGGGAMRRAARTSISKALTVVSKDMKRRAKAIGDDGSISKSITKKLKTYSKRNVVWGMVGPSTKYVNEAANPVAHKPSKTAHLIEFGTRPHVIRRKGGIVVQHPGTAPRPFIRPSIEANKDIVLQIMKSEYVRAIDKAYAKMGKPRYSPGGAP